MFLSYGGVMLELNYIGCHYVEDKSYICNRPEGSGDWLFLLFHSDVYMNLHGHMEHLSPGALMLYAPEYPQYYKNPHKNLDNDWFHFSATDYTSIIDEINLPINEPFYIDDISFVHKSIQDIEKEHLMKDIGADRMVDYKVNSLLIKISRHYNHRDDSTEFYLAEKKFREIRSTILSSIAYPWTVIEMAESANLSRSRFTFLYKAIFHVSPKDDLLTERFNMAKYLLQGNNQPVSSIARKVGYDDIYHFSKQFKSVTSQSPTEYRKTWQKKFVKPLGDSK